MSDLTQAQLDQFFATGELPETAAPAPAPAAVVEPPVEPVVEPTPAPVPAPTVNNTAEDYLTQMLAESRQREQLMQQQLADMQKQVQQLTAPKPPDPAEDPLGNILHNFKQLEARLDQMQQGTQQQLTQQQQLEAQNAFAQAVNASVKSFEATHTDYQDAYKHLRASRMNDFKDMGFSAKEAEQMQDQEELQIAYRALQQGKNPAEIGYSMAKRYGYQPKAAPAEPESKVEQIKAGLKATEGVKPGSVKPSEITAKNLDGVSDDDLNKVIQDDEAWARMHGASGHKSIF